MCGIIISTLEIPETANKYVKNRGPDLTNKTRHRDINFIHHLLHLTGYITKQPIIDEDIICIFNGEIYNYKELLKGAKSDVYSIIESYKRYGEDFVKYLDGEFVIILFDFKEKKLIITSDIFKTKPLFYEVGKRIIISSYESCCKKIRDGDYKKLNPNEMLIFSLEKKNGKRKLLRKKKVHEFDLTQKKGDYKDYVKAFEKAVLKRYPERSYPLILLSSGLDSGAIACCLHKYKKAALYVSMGKNEDYRVLGGRKRVLGENHIILDIDDNEKKYWKKKLEEDCEKFYWDWRYNINLSHVDNGFDMGSMLGKSKIIDVSKKANDKVRILYSGIGADEIMARNQYYSCGWGNVNEFPEKLENVYPWANFYEGSMENYLKGDEYVGGYFGYETRYPYCDKDLVQEFLWLKAELKNNYKGSIYKPPLLYYLETEKFPFHIRKLGFNV